VPAYPCSVQRKSVKKTTRLSQREFKVLNNKTHEQDAAFKLTVDVKRAFNHQRERTGKLVASIEVTHAIQIKQFNAAGVRRVDDTRKLLEIQCKGLSEEQKSAASKECNSKIGHFQVGRTHL
jgi:hypothetical protein